MEGHASPELAQAGVRNRELEALALLRPLGLLLRTLSDPVLVRIVLVASQPAELRVGPESCRVGSRVIGAQGPQDDGLVRQALRDLYRIGCIFSDRPIGDGLVLYAPGAAL